MKAFVDDMCIAEAVTYGSVPMINEYVSFLNSEMKNMKMCLNPKKSNVIIIDNSRDKRFSNYKVTVDNVELPNVSSTKLLGVLINNKCDWSDHVESVYKKACKKMYIIRKMKSAGISKKHLILLYSAHLRSILEYGCVLWSFSINQKQVEKLNSIERRALSIISGKYVSKSKHFDVCKSMNIENLVDRRVCMLNKFGIKLLKNNRFKHWLEPFQIKRNRVSYTRHNRNKFNFRSIKCRSERYLRSTIPTLVKHLRDST